MTEQLKSCEQLQKDLLQAQARIAELETARRLTEQRANLLQQLAMELTQTQQQERQHLARTLHDNLQQLLVGARFNLNVLRGQIHNDDQRGSLDQVNELLDESVTASQSLTMDLSPPILIDGTLTQILQWLACWAQDKHGLTVRVSADDHISTHVQEVRVLLFQAVRELLLNVTRHAKAQSATITMDHLEPDQIQITVADEGIGFDPDCLKGNVTETAANGFGLFCICQRLELLGGRLEIESRPGYGTRVKLRVPMAPAIAPTVDDLTATPQGAAMPATGSVPDPKRIRVLLADDHAMVRNGLARLLQMQPDIEVVGQAADGLQVVQMAMRFKPDIILMDVSMPYLSGVDVTRRLTQEAPGIRIIGLSMHDQPEIAATMTAAGAAAYLTKTDPPGTLIATIRTLAGKGSRQ